MQPTKIKQEVGFLVLYELIIELGYDNIMLFQEAVDVALCMNPQEHVDTTFIQYDEPQLKDKTKSELLGNLKSVDMDIYVVKEDIVGELQDISHKYLIYVANIIIN